MRRKWRERFPRCRLQRNLLVRDHGMHVGIANPRLWEIITDIHGACGTRDFAYLVRGPLRIIVWL